MNIPVAGVGGVYVVWLLVAISTVVVLAERKTDTRGLTILWGVIAAVVPPFGLLFILALLLKNDR